jgi:hypothetical protein
VGTVGGSEVYIFRAKKNEEIAQATSSDERDRLTKERDDTVRGYWLLVGSVIVLAGIILLAAASANGSRSPKRKVVHTDPGTCSWHGGVSDCIGGAAVCADGQYSPGLQPCYVTWE